MTHPHHGAHSNQVLGAKGLLQEVAMEDELRLGVCNTHLPNGRGPKMESDCLVRGKVSKVG